ncbi:MAG: response regulator [Verrucomicrobia bacterium]|nr:response regulator [Verrucomicrobiota bacterium]
MQSKRILLVDDDPRDRELALDALRQFNVANEIVPLRDGAEALDYLYRRGEFVGRTDEDPAVILLDLKMPRVDGFEVLQQIKADPAKRTIPVVVMTSSREEQDLVRSYAAGVNAYVVKPLDFLALVAAVRALGAFWLMLNEPPPGRAAHGA